MIQKPVGLIFSGLRRAGRMCAHAATRLEWAWLRRELAGDPELSAIFSAFKRSPESKWAVGADDVLRLYQLVHRHRPEHILEFGTGVGLSTAAMALAVGRAGRGRLTTIEQDPRCLALARQLIAPRLQGGIRFVRADAEIFQIARISRWLYFCGYAWQPEPGARFDFVLVDGPAGWYERGELVSLESGEVIRMLPFLAPGCLVYVDGRRSLVKKLKRYLKNYLTLTEQGSEYTIFVRTERPLGSLADLEVTDTKLVSPTSLYAR